MILNAQAVAAVLSSRLQALIAYLALHPGAPISRQQLAFVFWRDSEESQAQTNLRRLLHLFRSVLPELASSGGEKVGMAGPKWAFLNPEGASGTPVTAETPLPAPACAPGPVLVLPTIVILNSSM